MQHDQFDLKRRPVNQIFNKCYKVPLTSQGTVIIMRTDNLIFTNLLIIIITFVSYTNADNVITDVKKLLIDTDAGGDDAFAIILAAEAERLDNGPKIVGITCVNGNTDVDMIALNVLKTLKTVDRLDIPVYKGAAHPLLMPNKKDYYYGEDGLRNIDYPDSNIPSISLLREEHAVIAMINLVKENPGEITLVGLGPLTNIALAIRLYPLFLDELQQLIILGGSTNEDSEITEPYIEFNFRADPVANFIVFNSSTSKPITLIPYEATDTSLLDLGIRNWWNQTNNEKVWLIGSIEATFSDPEELWYTTDTVAMLVGLTSGSIVTNSTTYHSEAVYYGTKTAGMIIPDYRNATGNIANTNLIIEINKDTYKQLCLRYIQTI